MRTGRRSVNPEPPGHFDLKEATQYLVEMCVKWAHDALVFDARSAAPPAPKLKQRFEMTKPAQG